MTLPRESVGAGPLPLVCLHGWGLNLRVFDALREALGGCRPVISVDLPGHGAREWDPSRADLAGQVDQLQALLPARCILLGWSLGGHLALALARRMPARLAGLILVASTPCFVARASWPHGMDPAVMERFAAQLREDWQATVAEFLHLQVRGSREATTALAALQRALAQHGEAQPEALEAGLRILREVDLRPEVASLDIPTLVLSGQHDRITPPGASAWLAATLPRARHVSLARAGHAPFLSHAPEVTTALRDFLTVAA
jgi:pimeloyl-[acyl-carrier protein] methyl ester esterase